MNGTDPTFRMHPPRMVAQPVIFADCQGWDEIIRLSVIAVFHYM